MLVMQEHHVMHDASFFGRFARAAAHAAGHPVTFTAAVLLILSWIATGPIFGFSDTWQLVINTATTIITFLMVFLIQSAQNRDSKAIQVKLDELIRATKGAHTTLMHLEEADERHLDRISEEYAAVADKTRKMIERGAVDTGTPEVGVLREERENEPERPTRSRPAARAPRR
jgi:low affinity Fe/Cu permease